MSTAKKTKTPNPGPTPAPLPAIPGVSDRQLQDLKDLLISAASACLLPHSEQHLPGDSTHVPCCIRRPALWSLDIEIGDPYRLTPTGEIKLQALLDKLEVAFPTTRQWFAGGGRRSIEMVNIPPLAFRTVCDSLTELFTSDVNVEPTPVRDRPPVPDPKRKPLTERRPDPDPEPPPTIEARFESWSIAKGWGAPLAHPLLYGAVMHAGQSGPIDIHAYLIDHGWNHTGSPQWVTDSVPSIQVWSRGVGRTAVLASPDTPDDWMVIMGMRDSTGRVSCTLVRVPAFGDALEFCRLYKGLFQ